MSEFNNDIRIQDLPDDGSNNATDFYANFREKLNSVEKCPFTYASGRIVQAVTNPDEGVKQAYTQGSTECSDQPSSDGTYTASPVDTFRRNADEGIAY